MLLSELKALAGLATKGLWKQGIVEPSRVFDQYGHVVASACSTPGQNDNPFGQRALDQAAYIAAANPAAVLELLERLEAMEKALVAYGVCGCHGKPYKCLLCSSLAHHGSAVPLKGEK